MDDHSTRTIGPITKSRSIAFVDCFATTIGVIIPLSPEPTTQCQADTGSETPCFYTLGCFYWAGIISFPGRGGSVNATTLFLFMESPDLSMPKTTHPDAEICPSLGAVILKGAQFFCLQERNTGRPAVLYVK